MEFFNIKSTSRVPAQESLAVVYAPSSPRVYTIYEPVIRLKGQAKTVVTQRPFSSKDVQSVSLETTCLRGLLPTETQGLQSVLHKIGGTGNFVFLFAQVGWSPVLKCTFQSGGGRDCVGLDCSKSDTCGKSIYCLCVWAEPSLPCCSIVALSLLCRLCVHRVFNIKGSSLFLQSEKRRSVFTAFLFFYLCPIFERMCCK